MPRIPTPPHSQSTPPKLPRPLAAHQKQAFSTENLHRPLAYRVNAACDLLGVTRTTIYRWVKQGELTLVKLGPNASGISRASLEAWAAARGLEL